MLPTMFRFIWQSGFRGEDFFKSVNQKQELSMAALFVNGSELNELSLQRTFQGCFLPSFDSFGKAVLGEMIFQESTNQKQEFSVVAMFVNGSELNEHPLQRTFQVSIHLAKRFQRRRFFLNQPIRKKNCLWRPCLLMDRDKMSNLQREPSIDASYQFSLHLAEGFQRRRLKCEKLTDDIRRTTSDGKSSHCLWQGELKRVQHGTTTSS